MAKESPDILHPLSSLEWGECPSLPVEMIDAQTVYLNGTLYVGGGFTSGRSARDDAKLYSCKPGVDGSWTVTDTPTYFYALATYNSQLVLVGGLEYPSNTRTNKIYTLVEGEFLETLPPMIEKRYSSSAVSNGSVLVVAGGYGESGSLSSVEVFKDGKWTSAPSLPTAGCVMSSVLDGDQWYLVNSNKVFRVSLQSLLSSTEQSPWETLPDVPNNYSAVALFGSRIVSIGGDYYNLTSSIHALSSDTQSWVHVADLPEPLYRTSAITLPTGELMVIGGGTKRGYSQQVFRAIIKVPLVDPNIHFSTTKLFQLHRYGINLIEALSKESFRFHVTSDVQLLKNDRKKASSLSPKGYIELIFKAWERSKRPTYPPTWEGLFTVLRKMGLSHLTEEIRKYVIGSLPEIESSPQPSDTEEGPSEGKEQGVGEEVTLKLKAEVKHLRLENEDLGAEVDRLTDENEQLRADIDSLKKIQSFKQGEIPPFEETHPELYYQLSSSTLQQPKEDVVSVKVEPQKTGEFVPEPPSSPQTEVEAKGEPTVKVVYSEKDVQQLVIENKNLRSQLALPSPVETETPFNLPGVEVVGETSVTVTNSVQTFNWPDYGFNLHIPQDSLPAGVDQCRLRIIASVAGQYQFPDNHELVSGVYWVRTIPPCQFKQPLTVNMQHCVKVDSTTELSFVRAISNYDDLLYTFYKMDNPSSFTDHSSYGSLKVNHFCGVGVVAKSPVEKKYCSNVYYLGTETHSRKIHFVVMRNIESYITMVKKHYDESEAVSQEPQTVAFQSDSITLDIPEDGVCVKGGWSIEPLMHPAVLKSDIDSHIPEQNQVFPHCQLMAECSERKERLPKLTHKVKMIGAKEPFTFFKILLDPYQKRPAKAQPSHRPSSSLPAILPPPLVTGLFSDSNSGAIVPSPRDYWQRTSYGATPQHFPRGAESALSIPAVRMGGRFGLSPPYPAGTTPRQHTGYYQPTLESSQYFPSWTQQRFYQSRHSGDSLLNIAGPRTGMTASIDYPTVTFGQLVDHVGINKDHLNKPCSDEHLTRIADLLPNWQKYAEALGLSHFQIQDIDGHHMLDNEMKAQRVIKMWIQKNAFKATYSGLIEVCLQQKHVTVAQEICKLVKGGFPSDHPPSSSGGLPSDHPPSSSEGLQSDHPPSSLGGLQSNHSPSSSGGLPPDHPPPSLGGLQSDHSPSSSQDLPSDHPPFSSEVHVFSRPPSTGEKRRLEENTAEEGQVLRSKRPRSEESKEKH